MRSIQISKKNLINNINEVKKLQPGKEIMVVVKGNAYGHGVDEVVKILKSCDVNYFCVATLEEAIDLRLKDSECKILVLYGIWDQDISLYKKYNIEMTVSNIQEWETNKDYILANKLKFHIKFDSGMNRMGFKSYEELESIAQTLVENEVELQGLYTHIAQYEVSYEVTKQEVEKFEKVVDIFSKVNINYTHYMNSASIQMFDTKFDNAIRIGNFIYGYYDFDKEYAKNHLSKYGIFENTNIKPILRLATKVKQIKHIKKGEFIGYGDYKAPKDMDIIFIDYGKLDGIIKQFEHPININNVIRYPITKAAMNHMFVEALPTDKVGDDIYLYEDLNFEANQDKNTRPIDFIAYLDSKVKRTIVDDFNN